MFADVPGGKFNDAVDEQQEHRVEQREAEDHEGGRV
jgi:hypothetical protein